MRCNVVVSLNTISTIEHNEYNCNALAVSLLTVLHYACITCWKKCSYRYLKIAVSF